MKYRSVLPVTSIFIFFLIVGSGCDGNLNLDRDNALVDSSSIDKSITDFMESNSVVGMSVATINNTADAPLIWSNQFGLRDRESGISVDAGTSFWLGSVSKAVMGMTLMIASERGFLQLDDNVQGLLAAQGGFSIDNPAQQAITVSQLTKHTSGIVDREEAYACAYYVTAGNGEHVFLANLFDVGLSCPEDSAVTLKGFLESYLDADGGFYSDSENFHQQPPGSTFEYSNIGAALAGYMVELTTGQDLASYAQQEIFTPLLMSSTSWRAEMLDSDNIATPYMGIDGELIALPRYELATWPDGGLRSNASDLAKLLSVVMNGGVQQPSGERLVTDESVEKMLPANGEDIGIFWAGGEVVEIEGEERPLIGHTGSDPGAFSLMLFDPISETGVVITGNGDDEEFDESSYLAFLEVLFDSAGKLR